jgi:hypothetical protein
MNTSTSRDADPPFDETLTREYWKKKFNLTETQAKHLKAPLIQQLIKCKDDEARRILMKARMQATKGNKWTSKSEARER